MSIELMNELCNAPFSTNEFYLNYSNLLQIQLITPLEAQGVYHQFNNANVLEDKNKITPKICQI